MQLRPRKRPCSSCPYRRDVPSGLWEASEYAKLPLYDSDTMEQAVNGSMGLFHCHQKPDYLCAGWVGCHDMQENLAVRIHYRDIDPVIFDYQSPIPLFDSGAEAAEHGMAEIEHPSARGQAKIAQLRQMIARRDRK